MFVPHAMKSTLVKGLVVASQSLKIRRIIVAPCRIDRSGEKIRRLL